MKSWLKKYGIWVFLGLILVYFAFLLFYQLWYQSFRIDEWYSSYVAKYMSLEWFYKSKYFLSEWLQALCFKFWWMNDFWARFPSVVIHLVSMLLMYLIPAKLTKNKYIWMVSFLVFWLLYREQWWARDARFYSLVQMMFLLWMYVILMWMEKGKSMYLNLAILITGLWVIFHPFLYCLWAILFWAFLYQYKKHWDRKSLFSKKYLVTWIIVIIWLVIAILFWTLWGVVKGSLTNWLSWDAKKYYFVFYTKHLWWELGIILVTWVLWMLYFLVRKKRKEVIMFTIPFLLFVYALVIKGYLMHSRYALLMMPLLVLSSVILIYYLYSFSKLKYVNIIIAIVILAATLFTTHYQFLPQNSYYFDYTSPQPDFKSAYAAIPDWKNIVSGFPTLCDWYYSSRGNCSNAIRVDLVHDWKTKVKEKQVEDYTKIAYIDNLSQLNPWTYYFVIDNLTNKSWSINKTLYKQITERWRVLFDSWESYNNIFVLEVLVK